MAQRGFNIGVFKAELNNRALLKPNLFLMEFSTPPGMQGANNNVARTLEYWVESTSMPGVTLNTYQAARYGYGSLEQRVNLATFTEMQVDVIFDADVANYNFFFDWMSMIYNFDAREGPNGTNGRSQTFELEYRDNYVADASVIIYDQTGEPKNKLTLRETYPKSIGDVRVAWADNNSYMRLPIVLSYNDWFQNDILE
jgi:T4-like virus tail tube protein gp19.